MRDDHPCISRPRRGYVKFSGPKKSLKVSDDGAGIQPADIANPASLGLLGMSERAAILGGKIAFGPNVPRGTTVAVQIPLHGKAGQTL